MDRVVNLAKRRGLVFPSSEIYGGFRSTWDYGPLGVLLKRNVKDAWWRSMVQLRDDIVGLDAADPHGAEGVGGERSRRHVHRPARRLQELQGAVPRRTSCPESGACPNCGAKDSFTEARHFNLMFKTHVGPVEDDASVAYLRPETAQGIFVNFKNVQTTTRKKPPFGIAQIGKSFRNEITPGNFIFRTREFEQMEMEYFVPPDRERQVVRVLGQRAVQLVPRATASPSRSSGSVRTNPTSSRTTRSARATSSSCTRGVGASSKASRNRTDFDLTQHAKFSGEDLSYFDQENDERYVPYVIEPAAGADRATLAFLLAAYDEDEAPGEGKTEKRTVLRLDPRLAPIKVAVLPLSKNERLTPLAERRCEGAAPALPDRRRPRGRDRPPLPAPGRGRHAVVRHGRLRLARRPRGHRPRTRLDEPGRVPIASSSELQAARSERDVHETELGVLKGAEEMMDDYYELLGVDADADTDDIRVAYRDRKAALDTQHRRGTQAERGRAEQGVERALRPVPARPLRRSSSRTRRRRATTIEIVDDDTPARRNGARAGRARAAAGASRRARAEQRAEAARAARRRRSTLPAGTRWPKPKQRIIAMVIDLFVLVVFVAAVSFIGHAVADSRSTRQLQPDQRPHHAGEQRSQGASTAPRRRSDDARRRTTQSDQSDAREHVRPEEERREEGRDQKQLDDARAEVAGTEQTFGRWHRLPRRRCSYLSFRARSPVRRSGKRLQHMQVLREDGSPLGVGGAVMRYGGLVLVVVRAR